MPFRMEATHFFWQRENWVCPQNDIKLTSPVRATYIKRSFAVFQIRWCLQWLTGSFCSPVMADNNLSGHYRRRRGQTVWKSKKTPFHGGMYADIYPKKATKHSPMPKQTFWICRSHEISHSLCFNRVTGVTEDLFCKENRSTACKGCEPLAWNNEQKNGCLKVRLIFSLKLS